MSGSWDPSELPKLKEFKLPDWSSRSLPWRTSETYVTIFNGQIFSYINGNFLFEAYPIGISRTATRKNDKPDVKRKQTAGKFNPSATPNAG